MVLPLKDAIYMVPRPLQKLDGDSPLCPYQPPFINEYHPLELQRDLNPNFHQSVENIISCHSPLMMIIIETRVGGNRAKEITVRLSFDGDAHADIVRYASGI